ncbi:hypothetical protein [Edwardsiella ictaluri]|uniref:Uncharacterized protein n=1 Tax=Edwardsiella ictaluri (strain 93-146) TaxID=634503 RepID=C5BG07_EDWI9|nr:hypothetical protein NT01EI_2561 [Edwardsiella ictaluri 93-146]
MMKILFYGSDPPLHTMGRCAFFPAETKNITRKKNNAAIVGTA